MAAGGGNELVAIDDAVFHDALDIFHDDDNVFRDDVISAAGQPQRCDLAETVRAGDVDKLQAQLQHLDLWSEAELSYALHLAVHLGDADCVRPILALLAYTGAHAEHASSALIDAATQGHAHVASLLLNNAANVNYVRSLSKRAALHESAQRGHREVCEVLLAHGANVNLGDSTWVTPLMVATIHNKLPIIELLIRGGSLVNIKDKYGESALYKAVDRGFWRSTRLLLGLSADCNVRRQGKFGNTLMHVAAKRNDPRILRMLLDCDADRAKNVNNFLDQTPFHIALLSGGEECIELLLDNGADPNRVDHEWTPLMRAASRGMPTIVCKLLHHGAKINARNSRGRTALHKAVNSGCVDVVRLLTRAGADVDASCRAGCTPLHLAASHAPSETIWHVLIELLLSGSDVNAINFEKHDASRLALTDFYLPTARVLFLAGARPRHSRALVRNCVDNLESVVSFLCGTDFRHVGVYKRDVIRENVTFLDNAYRNARTLQNACCLVIRRCLVKCLDTKVQGLPLPTDLKDIVAFGDIQHLKHYFTTK